MRFGDDILHSPALTRRILGQLHGEFAGVVYNFSTGVTIIFRDATGVRPLFYGKTLMGTLCFASEAKALIGLGDIHMFPPNNLMVCSLQKKESNNNSTNFSNNNNNNNNMDNNNNNGVFLAFPGGTTKGELVLFDVRNLKIVKLIQAHQHPLTAMELSQRGEFVATASTEGTIIRVSIRYIYIYYDL